MAAIDSVLAASKTYRSPSGDAATLNLKVPPYSEEAEQAVLGCMLIDKESLETALESLNESSFYCGSNGKIFALMKDMTLNNKVVDIVTLSDELSKRELLSSLGGTEVLTQAINSVPTTAHIQDYIRIIKEKNVLRDLINAATKMVGDCYKQAEAPEQLLDDAERLIYSIADQKRRVGLTPISDMIHGMIENLEVLHQNKQAITGVPTGFTKFDNMTAGLQPGNLIILAARPGVGKTALALNIALHCAVKKKMPVAIFSLEMSQQEIGMRLFSSITNIPLGKLRTGFFQKSDWTMITRKAELLSESPIHLDSSSAVTVLSLRSSARRLAAQLKAKGTPLSLILIDYLQLMQGSRRNSENRQTEIAEISRSLKGLAQDLNLPILALSQLNRSPEERGREGKPQLSHLRECVTGDTLVYLSDGQRVPISQLVGQTPEVWAMDPHGKIVAAKSDKVWRVGRRPVVALKLASGRSIVATEKHRLWTFDGWLPISRIHVGNRLAIPRVLPEPKKCDVWPENQLALLGQLIGDGSYLIHQPLRYTTSSDYLQLTPSRARVAEYASNDFFWDRIVSMEFAGEAEVYDLTVPGPACWISNEIISHNSGALEQDADLVAFIYREAMYKPDASPEDQNKAKLIIAKQRNGPQGEVELVFIRECARFENFESEEV